ncbi:GspH/FimT family pseudopilin [Agarilytica rhodophyticola]|uniref:GspH/FimT family pseudopilin n=1 Tax=Agarilytica rhodophyticola TaxID=1737490 RepID=UPI000B3474EA|nr:GspH/FimT family pseudopilin [Agarilytica rhodophyticola]
MKRYKYNQGLTLAELLICLSIVALLIGVGIPSFSSIQARMQSYVLTSTLARSLAAARDFALSSNSTVTLCGINQQQECVANDFKEISIFIDRDKNAAITDNEHIFLISSLDYSGQLNLRAALRRHYIRFKKEGSAEQAGSFIYCHAKYHTASSRITVSMSGRSYIGRDLDGDGIVDMTSGSPISC